MKKLLAKKTAYIIILSIIIAFISLVIFKIKANKTPEKKLKIEWVKFFDGIKIYSDDDFSFKKIFVFQNMKVFQYKKNNYFFYNIIDSNGNILSKDNLIEDGFYFVKKQKNIKSDDLYILSLEKAKYKKVGYSEVQTNHQNKFCIYKFNKEKNQFVIKDKYFFEDKREIGKVYYWKDNYIYLNYYNSPNAENGSYLIKYDLLKRRELWKKNILSIEKIIISDKIYFFQNDIQYVYDLNGKLENRVNFINDEKINFNYYSLFYTKITDNFLYKVTQKGYIPWITGYLLNSIYITKYNLVPLEKKIYNQYEFIFNWKYRFIETTLFDKNNIYIIYRETNRISTNIYSYVLRNLFKLRILNLDTNLQKNWRYTMPESNKISLYFDIDKDNQGNFYIAGQADRHFMGYKKNGSVTFLLKIKNE